MITVELRPTGQRTRFPCFFCGGSSEKHEVLPFVLEDGENTRMVVCDRCMEDRDYLAERVRRHVAVLRQTAEETAAVLAELPALPTLKAWHEADEALDREIAEAYTPRPGPTRPETPVDSASVARRLSAPMEA